MLFANRPRHSRVSFLQFFHISLLAVVSVFTSNASAGAFTVFGPQSFERSNGSPVTETVPFVIEHPGIPYTAKIYNGGLQDNDTTNELVSSGVVQINEGIVAGPNNFNQRTTYIEEQVSLLSSNLLMVTLRGKPGGTLVVEVVGEDNDPPTITAVVNPAPDATGWNTTAVNVSFECADQISGIASCSDPVSLTSQGGARVVTGTAVDRAGNTATTSVTVNFDSDDDGVYDNVDQCADTPENDVVDEYGCSASQRDSDSDGISDAADLCPGTPVGESVNTNGCALSQLDGDADGISDLVDQCPETPSGESPDSVGCSASQRDTDGDGISDNLDQCPDSAMGEVVDANGCPAEPIDADEDGVADTIDQCPNTPYGEAVYADGCSVAQLDGDGDGVADASDICPNTAMDEVVDANGCTQADAFVLPVDPVQVAPSLSVAESTSLHAATAFLYSGDNPIQTGVNPQTIVPERAAVVRGQVLDRFGNPVVGVKITVSEAPEYGQTYSRTDGYLDLAVNGGGQVTLVYEKQGYLTVHRRVDVPWQDYAVLPSVVMTPLDSAVTQVQMDTSTGYQIAQGSPVEDLDGVRQATLMFPPGTSAEMVFPGGGTQALSTISVRATEFTVGDNGPQAMPAELPPYSAYTYALELSVDQAMAAGASSVRFNQAVPFYVDNFLDLPTGVPVPVGYYDRELTAWIPSDNGLVIEILGVDTQGRAELDIDGSGQAATETTLSVYGITADERTQLAMLYSVGKSLWRTPVTHFTPFDCNFPGQRAALESAIQEPILSSDLSGTKSESGSSQTDPDCLGGSIIECQNQVLRENIDLIGVDFDLHYRGDRVEGRTANNTLEIPLTGDIVPVDLKRIEVSVTAGGRVFESTYQPFPNQQHIFTWDGIDAYQRRVQGHTNATVRIGYVYDGVYTLPDIPLSLVRSFAFLTNNDVVISESRQESSFYEIRRELLGTLEAKGLGGWTLDAHHAFDPVSKTLYFGNGERRNNQRIEDRVIDYDGSAGFGGDIPLNIANVTLFDQFIKEVAIAPNGTIYVAEPTNNRIRQIARDGTYSTYAGSGAYGTGTGGFSGDGGPATEAELDDPSDVSVSSNGTLYIADTNNHRVRRISRDGIITTVAGSGPSGASSGENSGDGGQATSARLNFPSAVAVAPDDTLYVSSYFNASTGESVIRRITPDGIIVTIAGGGNVDPMSHFQAGNPLLSPLDARLRTIEDISVDRTGVVYFIANRDSSSSQVYRIAGNGSLEHVAGAASYLNRADDIPATEAGLHDARSIHVRPNGDLYIAESSGFRVRKVSRTGIITTVLGNGTDTSTGSTPTETVVLAPLGVGVAPNGAIIVPYSGSWAGNYSSAGIKLVAAPLSGFDGDDIAIASENGSLLYQFNKDGRHVRTIDTLTNENVHVFDYDAQGLLTTITDFDGNVTAIERLFDGTPTAIISPYGHRTDLTLGVEDYLEAVDDPAGQRHSIAYGGKGLITEFARPSGAVSRIEYDGLGRLVRDENAAGGAWNIAREDLDNGYNVSITSELGRTTTHQVENVAEGRKRAVIYPDGTTERSEFLVGNRDIQYSADGTVTTTTRVPDFRWNDQAVIPDTTTTLPSGLSKRVRSLRSRSLNDITDPLSLREARFSTIINGSRLYSNVFKASTKTFTSTSPEQRVKTTIVDGAQRPLFETTEGLATINYSYDSRGRLSDVVQGIGADQRSKSYTYNVDGWLESVTDGLNRATTYDYDLVGRPIRVTLPDGRFIDYSYDANGNVTSIVPPGRGAHVFNYTLLDQEESYTAPLIGTASTVTLYDYDLDQQLIAVTRPDGTGLSYTYDTGGRMVQQHLPRGILAYEYDEQTGQLTSITSPDAEQLSFTYDGALKLDEAWAGTINGTVGRNYNNNFLTSSIAVNGNAINYTYDLDDLMIQAGALTLARSPLNGLLTTTSLGGVSSQFGYNSVGELVSRSAQHGTNELYNVTYTRDLIGRIGRKVETITGIEQIYDYIYDDASRLVEVIRDGGTVASYIYDSNGNRVAGFDETGGISASYDAQDRLLSYNTAAYSYTANGELLSKTEGGAITSYQYDVLGNLLQVVLPDETIDYVIDGRNRRVGKRVNGVLVQGFLYQESVNPVAELDTQNNVVARFVYGSRVNVPDYMIKDGITYRIVVDHLGSPRLVVNAASGDIVQRMNYDAFGRVLLDTNPGFQPFGFAGGIYDQQTGLVRFGARDYDPDTGRWTSKDPIGFGGGDVNLYGYIFNDPLSGIDPLGLARFGFRPLDGLEEYYNNNPGDNHNRAHEGVWFDDNPNENYGFFAGDGSGFGPKWCGEGGVVRPDWGHSRDEYDFFGPVYDDDLMRQALDNIRNDWDGSAYCVGGRNCQHFADALREEYDRLANPPNCRSTSRGLRCN